METPKSYQLSFGWGEKMFATFLTTERNDRTNFDSLNFWSKKGILWYVTLRMYQYTQFRLQGASKKEC